jgi:hypothetical protein
LYPASNIITITKSKKCETNKIFYIGKLRDANIILVVISNVEHLKISDLDMDKKKGSK